MPKHITLIRHGESQHHVKGLTGGWTDTPLTARGERQVACVARELTDLDVFAGTELISSDLLRARQTAEAISRQFKSVVPTFHFELRELGNGFAKDMSVETAKKIALPVTDPVSDWIPYPEAESWRTMSARIAGFMDKVMSQSKADHLLVVSHGNAMVALVQWWLGLGENYWSKVSFEFDCASITKLTVNQWGEKVISKLNDTSHLKDI